MFRHILPCVLGFLAVSSVSAADVPDPTMAAMAAQCPAAKAWIDKQAQKLVREEGNDQVTSPDLRDELHERAQRDQAARKAWAAEGMVADSRAASVVYENDASNVIWLKERVWHGGFPTPAQVGPRGVNDAWLLVQHADRDPGFQQSVLDLLAPRVADGTIAASDYALLVDRVRIHRDLPQVYGSQYEDVPGKPGQMRMLPVEDPAHLDARRASVGLMPSHDYACALSVTYAPNHS